MNKVKNRPLSRLTTSTVGVSVAQGDSTYADIPQGGSRANDVAFQLQTGTGFVEGTPIDLVFVITSDQNCSTNFLRLNTGVPGAEILFNNYSALAEAQSVSSAPKDLTPWDLGHMEPLWMADDASCLLKTGEHKYMLWHPNSDPQFIVNPNFLAHRLTRHGVVVGTLTLPVAFDELNNKITNSVGVRWDFDTKVPVPLTLGEYRWPKNAAPLSPAGAAYSLTNVVDGWPQWLTNVTIYPKLQDVWDMNIHGVAAGSVSVQEPFNWQRLLFDPNGIMDWFTPDERGLDAGSGGDAVTELRYFALLSTAGQFKSPTDWRWLGPLSANTSPAIGLLVNDAGMLAGYAGISTGDPAVDALRPTHAFRAPVAGEYDGTGIILNDLGVLTNGLHSFPRTMNADGNMVGYSDFDITNTGGLNVSLLNSHAVYWAITNTVPEWLTNYPASTSAPYGYGDAFGINDSNQIVGASMTAGGQPVGVLWQRNHNTNGESAPPYWEITDLNERLADASWQVVRAVDINDDGLILAQAFDAAGAKHAVLLIPMAMAVDNNRNGRITFDTADQTSASQPYRFWINDSEEGGDIVSGSETQVSGINSPNCSKPKVNGLSDCVNFFPVALCLSNTLQLMPLSRGYEYHLSQADKAVKFVYTDLSRTNAFEYLTNAAAAHTYGASVDEPFSVADTIPVGVSDKNALKLDDGFLNRILADGNKGVILVEGYANTTNPLVLEVWHKDNVGNKCKVTCIPLYLSLSGVEQMFRHINLRDGADAPDGLVGDLTKRDKDASQATRMSEPSNYPDSLNNQWYFSQKWFVFVVGSNVGGQASRGWESEVFKRMYWSGSKANYIGVSWFGDPYIDNGDVLYYYQMAVRNAFATAPALAKFVNGLSSARTIAGHSLACGLIASAIADHGMCVNNACLIDAALAQESFDGETDDNLTAMRPLAWQYYPPELWAAHWYERFDASDARSKLTWRNRFVGALSNNGNVYSFYSSTEDVLGEYDDTPTSAVVHNAFNLIAGGGIASMGANAWVIQEKSKGDELNLWKIHAGSEYGGWGFNLDDPLLNVDPVWYEPYTSGGSVIGRRVKTPDEIGSVSADLLSQTRWTPLFKTGWGKWDGSNPTKIVVDTSPSYYTGPSWIFDLYARDTTGSDVAANSANRAQLLAEAIPALSLPVGANLCTKILAAKQFNMPAMYSDSAHWPTARGIDSISCTPNWHHSDIDQVAYPYLYKLFGQIVSISNQ